MYFTINRSKSFPLQEITHQQILLENLLSKIGQAAMIVEKDGSLLAKNDLYNLFADKQNQAKSNNAAFSRKGVRQEFLTHLLSEEIHTFSLNEGKCSWEVLSQSPLLILFTFTESHKKEKALKTFRNLIDLESIPLPAFITRKKENLVFSNKLFCEAVGYKQDELRDLPLDHFLSELDGVYFINLTDQAFTKEIPLEKKYLLKNKERKGIFSKINSIAIKGTNNEMFLHLVIEQHINENDLQQTINEACFLDQILNAIPNYIFAKDENGKFILANEKTLDIFGIEKKHVLGKTDYQILASKDRANFFKEMDQRVLKTGKDYIYEESVVDEKNNLQHMRTTKSAIKSSSGKTIGVLGMVEVLTELKEKEIDMATAQRLSSIGSWTYHLSTQKISYSSQLENILKNIVHESLTLEELLQYVPAEYKRAVSSKVKDCIDHQSAFDIIHPIQLPSEDIIWVNTRGSIQYDVDNVARKMSGTVQDITERVIREKNSKRYKHKLRLALKSANMSAFSYLVEGDLINVERTTFNHFPLLREQVSLPRDLFIQFIEQADYPRFERQFLQLLKEPCQQGGIFRISVPNYGVHDVEILCSSIFDLNGNCTEITGIVQDKTKEREANLKAIKVKEAQDRLAWEMERKRKELELKAEANIKLKKLNEEIVEKNQAISVQAKHLLDVNSKLSEQRKKREELIDQLSAITNNVPVGIAQLDSNLNVHFVNNTLCQWLAKSEEELIGTNARTHVGEKLYLLKLSKYNELFQGKTVSSEWTIHHHTQENKEARVSLVPQKDKYENLTGLILLLEDISQLREKARSKLKHENIRLETIEQASKLDELRQAEIDTTLEERDRQLAHMSVVLAGKNVLLGKIKNEVLKIKGESEEVRQVRSLLSAVHTIDQWKEFELRFTKIAPQFYKRLLAKHPRLSKSDLRLCAFLSMNLSTKEIAQITQQNPSSIKVARSRLRKKLVMTTKDGSIAKYLSNF